MLLRAATAAFTLAATIAVSPSAFAFTGIGCPDLPEYARAQGTLQLGEGACNMTTAEAMRILRRERPDLYGSVQPVHHKRHRHHAAE